MSALSDQITEVLQEHYQVFDERGHINGTVPGKGAWDCWCGEVVSTTFEEVVAHVAERIEAELQFTEEHHVGQAGDADERHMRRWVSAYAPVPKEQP